MKINEKRRQVLQGALLAGMSCAWPLSAWSEEGSSSATEGAIPDEKRLWDIVVVGSGLAGVSAALSALEAGAQNVLLIEKGPLIGGHSAYSTGTLAVVGSDRQKTQGVTDSLDLMWEEAKKWVVRALMRHSFEKLVAIVSVHFSGWNPMAWSLLQGFFSLSGA